MSTRSASQPSSTTPTAASSDAVPADVARRIKEFRGRLGLTQTALAERLGVSFASVNRWENAQSKPSPLSWRELQRIAGDPTDKGTAASRDAAPSAEDVRLDFTAAPEIVTAVAEGERLSFGHMANPVFATEISQIDPLPHQRIAVYDHMLRQSRLRFLLADDAGAGKTIMSGLLIREMLARRLVNRILIVPPAGLVGNWYRELSTLFNLPFDIINGADIRSDNPFIGEGSGRLIVSVDTLRQPRAVARLQESGVAPYDLVIFDEAHKLSADRGNDLRVRKTGRYKLAEALAGVRGLDDQWNLGWNTHHLLLLTATPHMGKDYPYYALWRLLEPDMLATPEAFDEFPASERIAHFIRRTKEEMVHIDGTPLYKKRISETPGFALTQGEVSEQRLYDETTEYLRVIYNKAKLLNRSAARLAMSVFQRRLASSTYALLRSFERRIEKLDGIIDDVQQGKLTIEQMITLQQRITEDDDVLDAKTADDEESIEGVEENERAEDMLLSGVVAASLADLIAEREQVRGLRDLAARVYDKGEESKFEELKEFITGPKFSNEKLIVFTEHKDTLDFLIRRLDGMGFTGQIAQIHGGMHFTKREEEVEKFRRDATDGGARFMICTDAAAEGINLQFCWLMINYDIPWNPARLEQRMGRIHRYGQEHDPVIILNLVALDTREGRVLKTLLDKLEKIRKELGSDKVFDCIGRLHQGVSIKRYMELAVIGDDPDEALRELEGEITKEQVQALEARERTLYGDGGEVARELPRLREELGREAYSRLLPGYVRQYIQTATPLVGIDIDGDLGATFGFRAAERGSLDPLLPTIETYPPRLHDCLSIERPETKRDAIWIHPGEPIFEAFRSLVEHRLGADALRGAVFVDPSTDKPYLFHLAVVSVVRHSDPKFSDFASEETLVCQLVGVKQYEGAEIHLCPVEHLLLLKGGHGLPPAAQRLAMLAESLRDQAQAFLVERVARNLALDRRNELLNSMVERESFIKRGFDYREAELATARAKHSEKARAGNVKAQTALNDIKQQQRELAGRRAHALAALRREPELIEPAALRFIAHALVVPSSDPDDKDRYDANVEQVAMDIAWAWEETDGAIVKDVHTPDLAREAGLPDNPGFDLLSIRPDETERGVEVKGRAGTGDVEVSANEWARACNMRDRYWLYAVYDCATPNPRLVRVQDPFQNLLVKAKGSVLLSAKHVMEAGESQL